MNEIYFTVIQKKSSVGRLKAHQSCLKGLGIRRMNCPVQVKGTKENLGMMAKVSYMLKIEERKCD